jgi:hypothetical protein
MLKEDSPFEKFVARAGNPMGGLHLCCACGTVCTVPANFPLQ